MKVKIKKLHPNAVIPKYAKNGDAATDLTATSYEYKDGRHVYGTGIAIEIPDGYVGMVFPRSSIANQDLRLSNCVGIVDSGYRGEIMFKFENDKMHERDSYILEHDITVPTNSDIIGNTGRITFAQKGHPMYHHKIYKVGDRIGQLIIMPYPKVSFEETDELSNTERGTGSYGSSGS